MLHTKENLERCLKAISDLDTHLARALEDFDFYEKSLDSSEASKAIKAIVACYIADGRRSLLGLKRQLTASVPARQANKPISPAQPINGGQVKQSHAYMMKVYRLMSPLGKKITRKWMLN